ncbi:aldehyde ferredoxin oxidoreductase family protein [bacterium]|nr:aldehyde ferredoxin oxidoreductase family protein [bacterium]
MANGYWQRLLRVNLTTRETQTEAIEEADLKRFIGGAGLGAEILRRETSANLDAYDPENRLIFATGVFQGPPVPGGAKFSVVSISPLTGTFADTAAGASWGPALKDAGYDVLLIEGSADTPVYLLIVDEKVEIRDAAGLWGKDSFETVDAIHQETDDPKLSVASIGPAGERRVAIACIAVDKHSFAGRCGLGAVMGSKNLKAVAVRGTQQAPLHDPERARELMKKFQLAIGKATVDNEFRKHGTPGLCEVAEALGDMPIKYWDGDVWPEGAAKLGGENYTDTLQAKPLPCKYCPIGCHRRISITEPAEYALEGIGPEYETLGMMGSNLLIDDPKAVARANEIANRLGVDTISTGAMIGFAMECFEKGWITVDDTGGLALEWGDPNVLIRLTEQIGLRQGFGEIFAEGTVPAARSISPEAVENVVHVKGLDLPAHDPRACFSLAPSYATGTRGACHFRGPCEDIEMGVFTMPEVGITGDTTHFLDPTNQGMMAAVCQDMGVLVNSLVVCMFMIDGGEWTLTDVADLFNALTGWDYSVEDLLRAGERGFTVQRLINLRDGHSVATDVLPKKMFEAAVEGARAGKAPPLEAMLAEHYSQRGWDGDGTPTAETLARLGLSS